MATFFSDDGIYGTACCGHPLAASRSQIQCHPSCPLKWPESIEDAMHPKIHI
jgi:hypothetical protein